MTKFEEPVIQVQKFNFDSNIATWGLSGDGLTNNESGSDGVIGGDINGDAFLDNLS